VFSKHNIIGIEKSNNTNVVLPENTDVLISIGGDGTILRAAELVYNTKIPILAINTGNLGFLAEFELTNLTNKSLSNKIISKKTLSCVSTLSNSLPSCLYSPDILPSFLSSLPSGSCSPVKKTPNKIDKNWALNEIVINRDLKIGQAMNLELYINNEKFINYKLDGLIISTATGSTGYAFSAGAPIIESTLDCILITPIASHTLFKSPIILNKKSKIGIKIAETSAFINFDGQRYAKINKQNFINISLSKIGINFIKMGKKNWANTLKTKFGI
jgi:NAD+ kinase